MNSGSLSEGLSGLLSCMEASGEACVCLAVLARVDLRKA